MKSSGYCLAVSHTQVKRIFRIQQNVIVLG